MKLNVTRFLPKHLQILFIFIFLFALSSCKDSVRALSKDEMKAIVKKQNEILKKCFKDGNADNLAMMYTESAKLSPNGSPFVNGRDSIKSFWEADFKSSKLLEMKTNTLTIDGDENIIYETGTTTSDILYKDSVYHVKVKYVNVWRKQPEGDYKLDIDFWNDDGE